MAAVFASALATLRIGAWTRVVWDGEDWLYSWSGSSAVHSSPTYNPRNNETNIDLFFHDYSPERGDVIVDVGVENGEEIPSFCAQVGAPGRVYAIEADPGCCRRLRKLKALLKLDNLVVIEAAVGSGRSVAFFTQDLGSLANRLVFTDDYKGEAIRVEVNALEALLAPYGLDRVDLLKVNIEGAEVDLLKGLTGKTDIRNFCISCHDFIGPSTRSYDFVCNWLSVRGYRVRQFEPQGVKSPWRNYYLYASLPPPIFEGATAD
jgi:FkbM family methyltransferase